MDNQLHQLHTIKQKVRDWSDIILREWRNSNDEEYAWHLLNLIADVLVDNKGKTLQGFLLIPLGAILGLILPIMTAGHRLDLDTSNFEGLILFSCVGAVTGSLMGLLALHTEISWSQLLKLLTPSILDASKLIRLKNFILVVISLILLGLSLGSTTSLPILAISLPLDFWVEWRLLFDELRSLLLGGIIVGFVLGGIVGYVIIQKLEALVGVCCGISFIVADITVVNTVSYLSPTVADVFNGPGVTSALQIVKGVFWLSFGIFSIVFFPRQSMKPGKDQLSRSIHKNVFAHRGWWSWWQSVPVSGELENALRYLTRKNNYNTNLWKEALKSLDISRKKTNTLKDLVRDLHSTDWYKRFTARQILREMKLDQQLNDIVDCVDDRLCLECFYRHEAQLVALSLREQFVYSSCRNCADLDSYITCPSEVTVVLDRSQEIRFIKREDEFRVNWLHHPELFDFDRVDILDATDEDVERFAVQVGNDTDEIRGPKYKKMRCVIDPTCELSDNTLRILQQTFGEVVRAV